MIIRGAEVWNGKDFASKELYIDDDGFFSDVSSGEEIDLSGKKIIPGFVDTHIHGCFGYDISDGDVDGIIEIAKLLPRFGVTSFCPTTMTMDEDSIFKSLSAVDKAVKELENAHYPHARILGVHLEGPFLSPAKSGAQGKDSLLTPRLGMALVDRISEQFPGLVKIIDIAPELDGADEFICRYKDSYIISAAHTECTYEQAMHAFELGVSSVTHLLNATTPIEKRAPGIACAAMDSGSYVEIICDGIHIQPPVLRTLFRMFDQDRIIVISDSMRGSGMPDGSYVLGDVEVECRNGRTYFGPEGNLAGSVTNLAAEYKTLISSGIDQWIVIDSMTCNPMARLGNKKDLFGPGMPADLIVFDGLDICDVFCHGKRIVVL